jgi:hypothetical protein
MLRINRVNTVSNPRRTALLACAWALATGLPPTALRAADLPFHRPLRILIVSDEVNPHNLPPEQLTQPGDLSQALLTPGNGLYLSPRPESVREIPTDQIELATTALSRPFGSPDAYDVLIYFAHRIPNGANAALRQQQFVAAVEAFLVAGGGVVSFHHGSYFTSGKEAIVDLIGAAASGNVPWDTVQGQNVIATAPGHFVACYGLSYTGRRPYADPARGVAGGSYPYFNNTPDERYPVFNYNASIGPHQTLFGSDYADSGTTHLLGFTHQRPQWSGRVVAYQPGEYQPNALDVHGRNFQILANAIVYSANAFLPDDMVLTATRGAATNEVVMSWTGCHDSYRVYRGTDPAQVVAPENLLGNTTGRNWTDATSTAGLNFYLVEP